MTHAFRRTTRAVLTALLIAVIPVAGIFDFAFLAQQFSQVQILGVTTGSMVPTLQHGAAVIERPASASDVRKGDVVSLDAGDLDIPVTHRVTHITRLPSGATQFTLKGDANAAADPTPYLVQPGAPVWREAVVIPHGATVVSWTHSWRFALIGLGAVLAISVAQKLTSPLEEQENTETKASSGAATLQGAA